jgi:hypothetical protein
MTEKIGRRDGGGYRMKNLCTIELKHGGVKMNYFERVEAIESVLCELTGEQVYGLFTGWHGLQLLDEAFYRYLIDEGVLPDEDEAKG